MSQQELKMVRRLLLNAETGLAAAKSYFPLDGENIEGLVDSLDNAMAEVNKTRIDIENALGMHDPKKVKDWTDIVK
jgi:hypothetical protein